MTSPDTRIWQARRSSGPKRSRSATERSLGVRGAQAAAPFTTTTRQVEQMALPPQAWAKGIPARRAGGRIASDAPHSTTVWSGRTQTADTAHRVIAARPGAVDPAPAWLAATGPILTRRTVDPARATAGRLTPGGRPAHGAPRSFEPSAHSRSAPEPGDAAMHELVRR